MSLLLWSSMTVGNGKCIENYYYYYYLFEFPFIAFSMTFLTMKLEPSGDGLFIQKPEVTQSGILFFFFSFPHLFVSVEWAIDPVKSWRLSSFENTLKMFPFWFWLVFRFVYGHPVAWSIKTRNRRRFLLCPPPHTHTHTQISCSVRFFFPEICLLRGGNAAQVPHFFFSVLSNVERGLRVCAKVGDLDLRKLPMFWPAVKLGRSWFNGCVR